MKKTKASSARLLVRIAKNADFGLSGREELFEDLCSTIVVSDLCSNPYLTSAQLDELVNALANLRRSYTKDQWRYYGSQVASLHIPTLEQWDRWLELWPHIRTEWWARPDYYDEVATISTHAEDWRRIQVIAESLGVPIVLVQQMILCSGFGHEDSAYCSLVHCEAQSRYVMGRLADSNSGAWSEILFEGRWDALPQCPVAANALLELTTSLEALENLGRIRHMRSSLAEAVELAEDLTASSDRTQCLEALLPEWEGSVASLYATADAILNPVR